MVCRGRPNTTYFHALALLKHKHRSICIWRDGDDSRVEDQEELQVMVRDFFIDHTFERYVACDPSYWKIPLVSPSDKRWLNHDISAQEIKEAVFQMDPHKAPGSDSMLTLF